MGYPAALLTKSARTQQPQLVQFDFLEAVMAEHTQHGRIGEVVVCITSDLGKSNLVFNVIAPVTVSSISLQVYLPFRL